MNWSTGIIASFLGFGVFIGILVSVCIRQDISLVSKNYYEEELQYEDQIKRIRNTSELSQKPTVFIINNTVRIQFADGENLENCIVEFFRPSDHTLDKQFTITSRAGYASLLETAAMPKGLYHVKIRWKSNNHDYFFEQPIIL